MTDALILEFSVNSFSFFLPTTSCLHLHQGSNTGLTRASHGPYTGLASPLPLNCAPGPVLRVLRTAKKRDLKKINNVSVRDAQKLKTSSTFFLFKRNFPHEM